ncbi:MAG: RNA polymerase factor sigma-54 [bacterium]
MALEIKQTLNMKLTHRLMMVPMLQQSIKLLQLSKLELTQLIHQELQENPMLEELQMDSFDRGMDELIQKDIKTEDIRLSEEDDSPRTQESEIDWQNFIDDDVVDTEYNRSFSDGDERELPPLENILTKPQSLQSYLLWQLRMSSSIGDEEFRIGEMIIGNIDENGYLCATIEEIAGILAVDTPDKVEEVLHLIQKFDPLGVGARTPQECLMLQIKEGEPAATLIRRMIEDHLPQLEAKQYQIIAKSMGINLAKVKELADIILTYDPKPGRRFNPEASHYIVPDVYVYKIGKEYVVTLNDEGLPQLRISNIYRKILRKGKKVPDKTRKYVEEKLRSAIWLIKSIQQRQRTLYNVAKSIVSFQKDFLDKGIAHLKPLTLVDVANDISMHESTISRVTTNKYMYTPQGIFELKFFFNSGLKKKDGDYISSVRVKEILRELIKNEDARKPYSDTQILELLKKQGVVIARRTIAKYRDELNILPSQKRKTIFSD